MAVLDTELFPDVDTLTYNTDRGIVIPSTFELKQKFEEEFKSNAMFGGDFDTTEEAVGGRLIEGATRLIKEILGMCAVNSNQLNFEYALGRYLDTHAAFYGLNRNMETATVVRCKLGGEANLLIPKGSVVEDNDGVGYVLMTDVILSDNGVADGMFACEIKGKRPVSAGTISTIRSSMPTGWDSVSNEDSPGIEGKDVESDDSLRERIRIARRGGRGFINGIYAKIMAIPEVKECLVFENCFSSPIFVTSTGEYSMTYSEDVNTVTVKPHSILIIADYADSYDTEYAIAEAIYKTKSCGCGMTPVLTNKISPDYEYEKGDSCKIDDTGTDTDRYLQYVRQTKYLDVEAQSYYDILFNRSFVEYVSIKVSVAKNAFVGSARDLRKAILNAVNAFQNGEVVKVDGLKIGQNVLAFEIAAAISDEIPTIQVKSVQLCTSHMDSPHPDPFPSEEGSEPRYADAEDDSNEVHIQFSAKAVIAIGMTYDKEVRTDVKTLIDGVEVDDEGGSEEH